MAESHSIIKSITGFIKDHLKIVNAQPEIKIEFDRSFVPLEYKQALRQIWEEILKDLDENPRLVLSREWTDLTWMWERYEKISIKEDNILLELSGAKYPMPGSKPPKAEETRLSRSEYSDGQITAMLPGFLNSLTTATPEKKRAVFISVSAAVRSEVTDDELVRKVADDVMQRLVLRKLIKGEEEKEEILRSS